MAFDRYRAGLRFFVAIFFIFAGVMHFVKPALYLAIVPPMLPAPLALIYVSGVFESLGGLGLLFPFARRFSGNGLILLLIAVFPANIYMLTKYWHEHGFDWKTVVLIMRLPFQYVIIAVVNWVKKS